MTDFPCLVRSVARSGEVRYRLGDLLVDRYLEFVAGRARPNTLRGVVLIADGVGPTRSAPHRRHSRALHRT